jgi:hypothetical protein
VALLISKILSGGKGMMAVAVLPLKDICHFSSSYRLLFLFSLSRKGECKDYAPADSGD